MTSPHIIYILSDEYCGTAMSHAGDQNVSTPNPGLVMGKVN